MDEQDTQVGIAALGDAKQPRLAASGMLPCNQTEPSPQLPGFGKAAGIPYSCHQGRCIQHANAGDEGEPPCSRIILGKFDELAIQCLDPGI